MGSHNYVMIIGNLGKDPESPSDTVCKFSVATQRWGKDEDGEKVTDWHRVVCFKKNAELARNYLKKGSQVGIRGRIQYGSYVKEGETKYTTDIICDEIILLDRKSNEPEF